MNDRSDRISRLLTSQKSRASYIKAKLGVLVPAQIRALRLKSTNPPMPYQRDLAKQAEMHQSRISMFETPGLANLTLETLSKVAAGLRSGVLVKFVPFHEMLQWENEFNQESFDVIRLDDDVAFLNPSAPSTTIPSQKEPLPARSAHDLAGNQDPKNAGLPRIMSAIENKKKEDEENKKTASQMASGGAAA